MNPSTNGATLQDPSRVRALTKEPGDEVYYSGSLTRPGTNSLRCILVPTALDKASAVALDYASALVSRANQ